MNTELVRAENVTKTFATGDGRSIEVLRGVDISIARGEMIGIVGASGAGKSTLLHILGTLDRPTTGKILFEGENIFDRTERQLAGFRNSKIGFVFQHHYLLPEFDAVENVMMPLLIRGTTHAQAAEKAKTLLDYVGLSHRYSHRPGKLSGGEQQRVAVARALVTEPDIVLADEPTGNLDTKTGDDVFELFRRFNIEQGRTFVIVTHNEKLVRGMHRHIELADGKPQGL